VRDARERGYTAAQTIDRWESVRRGEKRHIFPFQENADVMFNSALAMTLRRSNRLPSPCCDRSRTARRNISKPNACWLSSNGSCRWISTCAGDLDPVRNFWGFDPEELYDLEGSGGRKAD
jgi:hypothetical protein